MMTTMGFRERAHRWLVKPRRKPKLTPEEQKAKREERKIFLAAERQRQRESLAIYHAENAKRIEAIKAKEAAEREELLRPKVLRVLNRGLLDVLVWHKHHRARNWVAVVTPDPSIAGGLVRDFFPRAAGGFAKAIVPEDLVEGAVVEFGADYVSCSGNRTRTRIYAVVLSVAPDHLVVKPYDRLEDALTHETKRVRIV
jgi:hypothetical protein